MSGDMGIAPTAAGGQAQRAAADVGATSVGSGVYDHRALATASRSLGTRPASREQSRETERCWQRCRGRCSSAIRSRSTSAPAVPGTAAITAR